MDNYIMQYEQYLAFAAVGSCFGSVPVFVILNFHATMNGHHSATSVAILFSNMYTFDLFIISDALVGY